MNTDEVPENSRKERMHRRFVLATRHFALPADLRGLTWILGASSRNALASGSRRGRTSEPGLAPCG